MIKHTWNTRKSDGETQHGFSLEYPTEMAEMKLITARWGSVARMMEVARKQSTVAIAPGIRKRLPDLDVAKAYVATFCDNGSKDTFVPKLDLAAAAEKGVKAFDKDQLALIAAAGMRIENLPEDDDTN